MTFLAPMSLWLFLPFAGLLLWRLWRADELKVDVSTSRIWRQVLAEGGQPEAARRSISRRVIVEALAGAMLILALAQPAVVDDAGLLVVIDRRGAMSAPARRQAADEKAAEMTGKHEGPSRITELTADDDISSTSLEDDLADIDWRGERVVFVTDYLSSSARLPAGWGTALITEPVDNAGFVAASGRSQGRQEVELFVSIGRTAGAAARTQTVEITAAGAPTVRTIPADGSLRFSFTTKVDVGKAESMSLKLRDGGELAFDDEVRLWRPLGEHRLILDPSEAGAFAAEAVGDAVRALKIPLWTERETSHSEAETMICFKQSRPDVGSQIVFGSLAHASTSTNGRLPAVSTVGAFQGLPGLESLLFSRAFTRPLPKGLTELVATEKGAVVILEAGNLHPGGKPVLHIAGDPGADSWAEEVCFPLFVRAALEACGFKSRLDENAWLSRRGYSGDAQVSSAFVPEETMALVSNAALPLETEQLSSYRSQTTRVALMAALLLLGLALTARRP